MRLDVAYRCTLQASRRMAAYLGCVRKSTSHFFGFRQSQSATWQETATFRVFRWHVYCSFLVFVDINTQKEK